MSRSPRISVVIPVFNRADLIPETIQALQAQTFQDWECIVVDDHSTDGTRQIVADTTAVDPRFRLVDKPEGMPKGPSSSRNHGLDLAIGEIVHFFDSDDLFDPMLYSEVASAFESSSPDFLICRIRFFQGRYHHEFHLESPPVRQEEFVENGICRKHLFYTQNFFWNRNFLRSTEVRFDERLAMCEDLDFAVRNTLRSSSHLERNDLFVYIREHLGSLSKATTPEAMLRRNLDWFKAIQTIVSHLRQEGRCTRTVSVWAATTARHIAHSLIHSRQPRSHYMNIVRFMNRESIQHRDYRALLGNNAYLLAVVVKSLLRKAQSSIDRSK